MPRMLITGLMICAVVWPLTTRATPADAPPAPGAAAAQPLDAAGHLADAAGQPADAAGQPADAAGLARFKEAIRALYDLKERAWAAGDAETIVTRFYSADAVSAGEGDPETMAGREAFRKAYRQYVKDVRSVRIESMRTYVNGNAGWDWANFYADVKPDKQSMYPPSPVRIVFLWAREHGRWICKGDIFVNGRLPPLP